MRWRVRGSTRWCLPAPFKSRIYLPSPLEQGRSESLAGLLDGLVIASIGPVCSRALRSYGITPSSRPSPPNWGPLVSALESAFERSLIVRAPSLWDLSAFF